MNTAWTVNPQKLEQARAKLGLKFPVRIRLLAGGPQMMAGKYHGLGIYGPTTDEALEAPTHHITVKAEMTPGMANTCLWHELTHAMQCERYVPENGDYRVANAELAKAFGREMKQLRRDKGTTSKALTWDYSKVSFEEEAHTSDKNAKEIDLIDIHDETANRGLENLVDEHGRFTWRVDVFFDGKWDKHRKERTPDRYYVTMYVVAKDEWDAKKFVRDENKLGWNNTTCHAYLIRPFPKKQEAEGGVDSDEG